MKDVMQAISACLGYNISSSKWYCDPYTGITYWNVKNVKPDDLDTVKTLIKNNFDCSHCAIKIYESAESYFESPIGWIN